jgi:iron complex transport system permease protein
MNFLKRKAYYRTVVVILAVACFVLILAATAFGSVSISITDVGSVIYAKIIRNREMINNMDKADVFIVWNIRLPRILLSCLVGGLLSVVGTAYQAVFKNPMADPYILGTSSGAAFGATVAIILGFQTCFLGVGAISLSAFAMALLTTFIVYRLSKVGNKISTTSLLLAGIVMSSFLSAIISMLMIFNQNNINSVFTWTLGSFSGAKWSDVKIVIIPVILGVVALFLHSRELNAMIMGDEHAHSLGVDVEKTKKRILILSSFLAAFAVAVSGIIGFVGLIVPHLFRLLVGPDHKILMPVSILGGAIFMLICDTIARSIIQGMELPVGIITAIFGGPFFLFLLRKSKRYN